MLKKRKINASDPTGIAENAEVSPQASNQTSDLLISPRNEEAKQLTVWRKVAYGLGGPPMQMASNCIGFYLVVFLLETAGLNPYYNSVIQLAARAWDAITDPLMGYFVSKTNSRFGRFRPWLLISAPFCSIFFFLLFFVPSIPEEKIGLKFVYYLFMILFLQTAKTAFHVPYSSMTMVLTTNAKERDECSLYRMFFELSGVLVGVGVFGSVMQAYRVTYVDVEFINGTAFNVTRLDVEKSKVGYMIGSGIIAVLFSVCALFAFFGTREKKVSLMKQENYLKSLKRILTFKPYILLMFAFLFISLGNQIVQGNIALYVTYTLRLNSHINNGIITLLATAIFLMPPLYFLMQKIGKKNAFRLGLLNMFPVMAVWAVIQQNPPLGLFYFFMVWSGLTASVAYLVPWSMLPDVIDDFMVQTGVRKEAAFYSLYVFFTKLAVGVSISVSSFVIGAAGYESGSVNQPETVSTALRYFVSISVVLCLTASFVCLYFYPLDKEYMAQVHKKLRSMKIDQEVNTDLEAVE